jgi:hypothetical protein
MARRPDLLTADALGEGDRRVLDEVEPERE